MAVADFPSEMIAAWRDATDRAIAATFMSRLQAWLFHTRMCNLREDMIRENHEFAEMSRKVRISRPFEVAADASEGIVLHRVLMSTNDSAFPPKIWPVSYDLPSEEVSPDQIEDTMSILSDMGITVVENEDAVIPEQKADEPESAKGKPKAGKD